MITLIEDVELFCPERRGLGSLLIVGGRIAALGHLSWNDLRVPGLECTHIPGSGLLAIPGLIDPHEHLIGGSGESGFGSQTPEIFLSEILAGGITTVVGCLGVDTSTRTMPALLGKAKSLREQGLSAFLWTGGYPVPPTTLTGSLTNDILFIDQIIGSGELALADLRSSQPEAHELARIVSSVRNAGLLAGKAGVTHLHMGETSHRFNLLHTLLRDFDVDPSCLYPTHVERTEALMRDAVDLSRQGITIDLDTFEEDIPHWVRFFLDHNGDSQRLTISSDAAINSPRTLLEQLIACVRQGFDLPDVLPFFTVNTAGVLKLHRKGHLAPGMDADIVLLRRTDLELMHVFASGQPLFAHGRPTHPDPFFIQSNRTVHLHGNKRNPAARA